MLLKLSQTVVTPGRPAQDYRPYSKTCPPPPSETPPRGTKKTVCGTQEVYSFLVYLTGQVGATQRATETRYVLPGLPTVSTFSGLPYTGYTTVPGSLKLVSSTPYCKTVTVYG